MVNKKRSFKKFTLKKSLIEKGINLLSFKKKMKGFWSMNDKQVSYLLNSTEHMNENDRWRVGFVIKLEMKALN